MFWGMISVAPDAIPTRRISSDFGIEMRCDHFPIQFPCLNLAFDYGLAWLAQGEAHGCVCVCACVCMHVRLLKPSGLYVPALYSSHFGS